MPKSPAAGDVQERGGLMVMREVVEGQEEDEGCIDLK
jgi:hypothetical protein